MTLSHTPHFPHLQVKKDAEAARAVVEKERSMLAERDRLLREKDAELEELRQLLRSKPARDPAVGTDPAPALVPAPAEDRTLADAVWPPGWVE